MKALTANRRGSSQSITFRLNEEDSTRIQKLCDQSRISMSEIMRGFIEAAFRQLDTKDVRKMADGVKEIFTAVKEQQKDMLSEVDEIDALRARLKELEATRKKQVASPSKAKM